MVVQKGPNLPSGVQAMQIPTLTEEQKREAGLVLAGIALGQEHEWSDAACGLREVLESLSLLETDPLAGEQTTGDEEPLELRSDDKYDWCGYCLTRDLNTRLGRCRKCRRYFK